VFRGFLFRGLAEGWGAGAAIAIPAVLFTIVHTQYEPFLLMQILAVGLLFGWLRLWSGSTLLTTLLHAVMNSVAFAQAALRATS
jgi:membrane protease YdiL (CAAX protease family)